MSTPESPLDPALAARVIAAREAWSDAGLAVGGLLDAITQTAQGHDLDAA